MSQEN